MATKDTGNAADSSTEEKIKAAARTVFMKKGFAATRTRDIAEEAGINLALLNYYFRSKEKLFELVMFEKFQKFFGIIINVAHDSSLSLDKKVELFINNYINLLMDNPDLPIFILSEIRDKPERFVSTTQLKALLSESSLVKQLREKRDDINPLQLIISLLGLTVVPFLMRPLLQASGALDEKTFKKFIEERRVWIKKWFNAFLKTK
jgi:AcrR family transcriptional regulator